TVGITVPEIVEAASASAGAPFQGGKALRVHSGGEDEGYFALFNPAFAPGPLTIEYIVSLNTADIGPSNTVALQYIGGTEWPFGQSFMWMIRVHGVSGGGTNKLYFLTDKNDPGIPSNSTVPVKEWFHVAQVLNYNSSTPASSSYLYYINGTLQGSTTYNASDNSWLLGCSTPWGPLFSIGFHSNVLANLNDHRGMDGYIDALAISTAVLAPGSFVLSTSPVPLSLSASTISKPLGGSAQLSASGGLAPYTWSFSTTSSVDSVAIGYISATTGENIIFYATGVGEADLFCIDSNAPAEIASAHLIVVPTKAPLFPEPEMKTTIREVPMRVLVPTRRGWELFE
ncbi:MAG: hypothetical protein QME64_04130, partial [bacterium]|nr:hypothetical protein [bacterium]